MKNCSTCGATLDDGATTCVVCRKPVSQPADANRLSVRQPASSIGGYEYRSATQIAGLPLVHIAYGSDAVTGRKKVAKGIIAIGDMAVGVIAVGGVALGGLAMGGLALGLVGLGGFAIGLMLAMGGAAVGSIAVGGGAIGLVAIGGGAFGYYAFGGGAFGAHTLSAAGRDPEAVEFFSRWLGDWVG